MPSYMNTKITRQNRTVESKIFFTLGVPDFSIIIGKLDVQISPLHIDTSPPHFSVNLLNEGNLPLCDPSTCVLQQQLAIEIGSNSEILPIQLHESVFIIVFQEILTKKAIHYFRRSVSKPHYIPAIILVCIFQSFIKSNYYLFIDYTIYNTYKKCSCIKRHRQLKYFKLTNIVLWLIFGCTG